MKFIDSHIHTYHCEHAEGEVNEIIDAGIKNGVTNIGFCEHFTSEHLETLPKHTDGRDLVLTRKEEFKEYCLEVNKAKKSYEKKNIKVRLGTEVDYFKGQENNIRKELGRLKGLDFIMGSVHFAGNPGRFFEYYSQKLSDKKILEKYRELLILCIKTDIFDVIGHLDQIRFNLKNPTILENSDFYEEVATLLKEHEMGVDVNTKLSNNDGGFDNKGVTPGPIMLKLCKEKNIPMVLGSDAHSPSQVSRNFKETISYLKNLGINELTYFEKRKPVYYKI